MSQSLILIGICNFCEAKAYYVGGSTLDWQGSGRSQTCNHQLRQHSVNKECFPTENEAKYRKCLSDFKEKCKKHITNFENHQSADPKLEIDAEFDLLQQKLDERRESLKKFADAKKDERIKHAEDMKELLAAFHDKCDDAINEICKLIQNQAEDASREQQCLEIARNVAQSLPVIYEIPHKLSFKPKDIPQISSLITTCGELRSTGSGNMKRIEDFRWEKKDDEWINPKKSNPTTVTVATSPTIVTSPTITKVNEKTYSIMQKSVSPKVEIRSPVQTTQSNIIIDDHANMNDNSVEQIGNRERDPERNGDGNENGNENENGNGNGFAYDQKVNSNENDEDNMSERRKKKKEKEKVKLILSTGSRRIKYVLTDMSIDFDEFKTNVKQRAKIESDFTMQISSGTHLNKALASGADMKYIQSGENEINIDIISAE